MTVLTHLHGPAGSVAGRSDARASGKAHMGAIKRFLAGVLSALAATAAVAGAMALKGAYFFSHFSY